MGVGPGRVYKRAVMAQRGSFSADRELSKICTELWKLDENRLKPGVDYQINLQGGKVWHSGLVHISRLIKITHI